MMWKFGSKDETRLPERRKPFEQTPVCHQFCIEMQRHTPECTQRQIRAIIDAQAQPTGEDWD